MIQLVLDNKTGVRKLRPFLFRRTMVYVKQFTHRVSSPVVLMHATLITIFILSMMLSLPTLG
ncbi:hypothetical protein COU76_04340 [Candidatus Peregrinibacteria bacterium CG10_big_fil_rev_8_21_14_0_10_49_10]|nr:MAG: hypothetical protein COU76_04340 [Candidatus Peregrinibacteria bacterium CG10_big_fil_rev_8_21_14_0_10_49_10]